MLVRIWSRVVEMLDGHHTAAKLISDVYLVAAAEAPKTLLTTTYMQLKVLRAL
jgi:hypothetical protein